MNIDERVRTLITTSYERAPAVRARFDQAGITPDDIQTVEDLVKVPVLSKDEVIRMQQSAPPFGGLLTVPLEQVRRIFLSPGPLFEPDAGDSSLRLQMGQEAARRTGFVPGDIVLNSLSYHLVPAGLYVDRSLVDMGCTVIPGGVGNSEIQLDMLLNLGVTAYVGTPSFLAVLLQKIEEKGLDIQKDLKWRKAIVTAEPVPPGLFQLATQKHGLTLANVYATAEFGFIAINLDGGLAFQLLETPIVQVIDPDSGQWVGPGEVGEVVITDLHTAYSLIRIGTGDMAINLSPGPGSRQSERAVILVGRSGEAVKVRGMFVHPNQLRFAARQVAPTATAVQGVVSRTADGSDHVTVRVALPTPPADPAALSDGLKQAFRDACRVRINEIQFLDPEAIPTGAPGMVDEREWERPA